MTHSRFRKKDSQSQEIDRTYRLLSDRYGVDLVELVYGKNGFMKTKYPNGFPDFKGDVVYSEKYWDEFERWLDKERGIILSDKYSGYADSKRNRDSDRLSLRELAFALIDYAFEKEENYSSNYDHGTWEDLYGLVIPVQVIPKWKKFTDDEFERVADIIENTGKVMSVEYDKDNKEFSVITRTDTWQDSKKSKTTKKDGALYGVKGVEFNPSNYGGKVYYKGYEFDYFDVEDELYDSCKEEHGKELADDDVFFSDYVKKNVKSVLDEFISNGQYLDKGYPYEDSKHRKSHDSKPRYKTFIVKANSYQDAVEKVKRKLKK